MSESLIGKILQAKLEFRDLSYTFVLVIEERPEQLIVLELPVHMVPDPEYPPEYYTIGTCSPYVPEGWPQGSPDRVKGQPIADPGSRIVLQKTPNGIEDEIHRVYELWDGLPKPYRFC